MGTARDEEEPLLEIGRIEKAHGLKGEVVVSLVTNVPGRSGAGRSPLRRSLGSGLPRWRAGFGCTGPPTVGPVRPEKTLQLVITSTRPFQQRHLVQFDGIDSRDDVARAEGGGAEGSSRQRSRGALRARSRRL